MISSLLKNAGWGVLGELTARLVKIAQVMILVRWLGAEDFGRFNHATSVVGLFAVFFDLGIATVAVREIARNPGNRGVLLEYGALKLISSFVGLGLLTFWAWMMLPSCGERSLVLLMGLYMWLVDFSSYVFVVYRARQQFWKETAVRAVTSVLQLSACVVALFSWGDLLHVVAALALSAGLALIPLVLEVASGGAFETVLPLRLWEPMKECLPVVGTAVVGAVYMNYDIVVLAKYVTMEEVGWYSVAVKTVFGIFIMPIHFFSLASLPALSAQRSSAEAATVRNRWLENFSRTTLVGAVLALGVGVLVQPLLLLAFGRGYVPAAPVLLAFTLPCFFFYLYTPLAQWVLLQQQQARSLTVSLFAALLNVALVLWWVPRFGVWGATVTAVATHGTLVVGHLWIVLHRSDFTGKEAGWRRVARTTLALGLSWLIVRFAPLPSVVVGGVAVLLFGLMTREQWPDFGLYAQGLVRNAKSRFGFAVE